MFVLARGPFGSPPRRAAAVAIAIVVALTLPDCGGSGPTVPVASTTPAPTPPPVTAPPAPTTLADLTATVTSPQANGSINCTDEVLARITLVNNGGTDVAVQGILKRSGVTAGTCGGDHDFTYPTGRGIAPAKATTVVLDGSLYTGGSGCCDGKGCGGSCRIEEGFEVITNVGNVPAGVFDYKIFYQNCPSCAAAGSAHATAAAAHRACGRTDGPTEIVEALTAPGPR